MPGPRIDLEDDPTPLVLALGADLERRLHDPEFAVSTEGLRGTIAIRSATTPEAATIALREDRIAVRHGGTGAQTTLTLDEYGRWDEAPIEGAAEEPELADWARALTAPPQRPWRDAAADLWSALERMPGAPQALLVVEEDSGDQQRFGSGDRAYEIRGSAPALVALLEGRSALMDEAFMGTIRLRGSFPEISVVTGAATRVRLGTAADDA